MYDKVRVKKSQKFEVNQDTSQKETKTKENGSGQPPGRRPGLVGAAHHHYSGRVDLFGFLLSWAVSRAFGDCFVHGFWRLFKLNVRVNYIDLNRFLEANTWRLHFNFLVF